MLLKRLQDRSYVAFHDLASEITWFNLCQTQLVEVVRRFCQSSWGGDIDSTSYWRDSKVLEKHVGPEIQWH